MLDSRQKFILTGAIVVGLAGGLAVALFQCPYVEVSQSFVVRNERQSAPDVYDYEGYYTLQTANESAKALGAWLTSPGGVQVVYERAEVPATFSTLRDYERAFTIRRADTPFFEVRYRIKSEDDAKKLAASASALLTEELSRLQGSTHLSLGSAPAVFVYRPVPYARNLAYGAGLAFLLALFLILFRRALDAE